MNPLGWLWLLCYTHVINTNWTHWINQPTKQPNHESRWETSWKAEGDPLERKAERLMGGCDPLNLHVAILIYEIMYWNFERLKKDEMKIVPCCCECRRKELLRNQWNAKLEGPRSGHVGGNWHEFSEFISGDYNIWFLARCPIFPGQWFLEEPACFLLLEWAFLQFQFIPKKGRNHELKVSLCPI